MFKTKKDDSMIILAAVDARIADKNNTLKYLIDIVTSEVQKSDLLNCYKEAIRIAMMHRNDLASFQYFHKDELSPGLYCSILQYNESVARITELEAFKRELELKIYRR
jgi:hypothetical protein